MKATLLAFWLAYYESARIHEETAPETEPVNEAPDFVLDFQNEPMLKDQLTLRNEHHGIEWNNRCCGSHSGF